MKASPELAAAKAAGEKFYFTGIPCIRGHISKRYISGSCYECKAEDREKNREKNQAYCREWYSRNSERVRQYRSRPDVKKRDLDRARAAYAADPTAKRNSVYAWRAANPLRAKEIMRASYRKHREKRLAKLREGYRANQTKFKLRARAYRSAKRSELAERSRVWRALNPEKARAVDRNKKAMRRRAPGRHTAADIESIRRLQRGKCAMCRVHLRRTGEHVDHMVALSRGGSNDRTNLQLLCPPCNMRKHTKHPVEFAQELGFLI